MCLKCQLLPPQAASWRRPTLAAEVDNRRWGCRGLPSGLRAGSSRGRCPRTRPGRTESSSRGRFPLTGPDSTESPAAGGAVPTPGLGAARRQQGALSPRRAWEQPGGRKSPRLELSRDGRGSASGSPVARTRGGSRNASLYYLMSVCSVWVWAVSCVGLVGSALKSSHFKLPLLPGLRQPQPCSAQHRASDARKPAVCPAGVLVVPFPRPWVACPCAEMRGSHIL